MLISQPGSDYQLAEIILDAGRARDITCLLTDIHGLLTELCLDPARPGLTTLAQACLRECDSLYTPRPSSALSTRSSPPSPARCATRFPNSSPLASQPRPLTP
jgi:hypothetical protein